MSWICSAVTASIFLPSNECSISPSLTKCTDFETSRKKHFQNLNFSFFLDSFSHSYIVCIVANIIVGNISRITAAEKCWKLAINCNIKKKYNFGEIKIWDQNRNLCPKVMDKNRQNKDLIKMRICNTEAYIMLI